MGSALSAAAAVALVGVATIFPSPTGTAGGANPAGPSAQITAVRLQALGLATAAAADATQSGDTSADYTANDPADQSDETLIVDSPTTDETTPSPPLDLPTAIANVGNALYVAIITAPIWIIFGPLAALNDCSTAGYSAFGCYIFQILVLGPPLALIQSLQDLWSVLFPPATPAAASAAASQSAEPQDQSTLPEEPTTRTDLPTTVDPQASKRDSRRPQAARISVDRPAEVGVPLARDRIIATEAAQAAAEDSPPAAASALEAVTGGESIVEGDDERPTQDGAGPRDAGTHRVAHARAAN